MKKIWMAPAFVALALVLASVEVSAASCTGSTAIAQDAAPCLKAKWNNDAFNGNGSQFFYQNLCSGLGKVSVRIDMETGSDIFDTTTGGGWTTRARNGHFVSEIYCCLDRGIGLCNGLSDLLTDSYCDTQLRDSPAFTGNSCTVSSATADVSDKECDLSTSCVHEGTDGTTASVSSSLSIGWKRVSDDVYACDGALHDGTCPVN